MLLTEGEVVLGLGGPGTESAPTTSPLDTDEHKVYGARRGDEDGNRLGRELANGFINETHGEGGEHWRVEYIYIYLLSLSFSFSFRSSLSDTLNEIES